MKSNGKESGKESDDIDARRAAVCGDLIYHGSSDLRRVVIYQDR
jgi:hypothetical protein